MSALARIAEMHVSSISQIESGRLRPYPSQAEKIANALDWKGDPGQLFCDERSETNDCKRNDSFCARSCDT